MDTWMRLPAWLLWAATAAVTIISAEDTALVRVKRKSSDKKIVCYYTNWSVYRPGTAKFSPQNINPYLCTHLIYAFGGLTKDNSLKPFDKYQDVEQGGYAKFNGLKTYNKNLKTLVAIGGWNEGSARFSPLVADPERRRELVKNTIKFLRQNHFDGLDLDWEYPSFRDGGKPRDRKNYADLVEELRAEFDRESQKTGRPRLLLTMAVPAGIEYIDKGYDIPRLNEYLDWMNILSYDYHSAFEPTVNHHAPLFALEEDDEYNFDAQLNIDHTVQHYIKLGADRNKLVLGIPTYGRSYTLFNPEATDIGSPSDGPGEQGEATREKGYLAYYEICEKIKDGDWEVKNPSPEAMGPFAFKGNQWVGYDDEEIARAKAKYVNDNDLGGIMFWSIDNDDFRGKCHGKPYPLIEAAKESLLATSNELIPSRESGRASSRSHEVEHTTKAKTRKTRPKAKSTTTTTTESSRSRTTPGYTTTTPVPPTTPDPGSDFVCKDEGFFPHPRDCKKYFWCLDSGPSSLGIVAHQFTCPSGLVFNKISDSCDYARNVICKNKPDPTTTTTTTTSKTTTSRSGVVTVTPRTTTTTTTTTTTEEPEYEEYEVEDEEEDPGTIKELLSLIKKLGGVEQLEKQLNLQDSDENKKIKPSLYNKFLSGRPGNKYRGANEESSTSKYVSLFRNRPAGAQSPSSEETSTNTKQHEKPQYVTITRNRSTTKAPKEEVEEEEEEVIEEAPKSKFSRRRPSTDASTEKEYVTVRRFRPQKEEATTPRYKSILRTRSTTEAPVVEEEESEEEIEEEKETDPSQKDKKYSSVIRENKRIVSELDESKAPSSTTTRSSVTHHRRGNHEYLNNLRGRTRSTTQAPTTSERPARRPTGQTDRRRYRPETRPTTTSKPDLTATNSTNHHTFPRRRTRPTTSTTEAVAVSEQNDSKVEESKDAAPDLPDLADPAVVAIHNLATVRDAPKSGPSTIATTPIRVASETPGFTIHVSPVTETSFSSSIRPVSTPANFLPSRQTSFRPFISSTVRQFPSSSTQFSTRTPSTPIQVTPISQITESFNARTEVVIQPRRQDTVVRQRTTTVATTPKEQVSQPRRLKPFSKVPKPGVVQAVSRPNSAQSPEYEYYDDSDVVDDPLADVPPSALKVKVHSDGYIECLDRGNFPHPFSCKKFISCAKMENNDLLGWEYTCPKHLSFDPVGGICNWSAGLGCQH